jgi:hypothetical protein
MDIQPAGFHGALVTEQAGRGAILAEMEANFEEELQFLRP